MIKGSKRLSSEFDIMNIVYEKSYLQKDVVTYTQLREESNLEKNYFNFILDNLVDKKFLNVNIYDDKLIKNFGYTINESLVPFFEALYVSKKNIDKKDLKAEEKREQIKDVVNEKKQEYKKISNKFEL